MKLERFLAKRKKTLEQFLNEMEFQNPEEVSEWLEQNGIDGEGFVFVVGLKPAAATEQQQQEEEEEPLLKKRGNVNRKGRSKEHSTDEEVPISDNLVSESPSFQDTSPKLGDIPSDHPNTSP